LAARHAAKCRGAPGLQPHRQALPTLRHPDRMLLARRAAALDVVVRDLPAPLRATMTGHLSRTPSAPWLIDWPPARSHHSRQLCRTMYARTGIGVALGRAHERKLHGRSRLRLPGVSLVQRSFDDIDGRGRRCLRALFGCFGDPALVADRPARADAGALPR